jgi:L-threonylcarbamoyladenylate synthase
MSALIIKKESPCSSEQTARALREGAVVIIPTDTVYGFSALAPLGENAEATKNEAALEAIKGRDGTRRRMIRLVASAEDALFYAASPIADELLTKWPGALSVIVRLKDQFAFEHDGVLETSCAFRCPGDEWLRDVIARTGCPVFSTSANRTGTQPLTKIKRIAEEFSRDVSLIVDGGDAKDALPSTIVDARQSVFSVVRQGAVVF